MTDVITHYDLLIDENNDPVYDTEPLQEYMDKWDGEKFINMLMLDKSKKVLEIGVGTGRIALKTAPHCKALMGIDISPKTVERAKNNLSEHENITLICGDFMTYEFDEAFDVIYSSLTFMHIEDKQTAINKAYSLLKPKGRFVLSIDKNTDDYIDMGTRKIKIYPDNVKKTEEYIHASGLTVTETAETEFAHIIAAVKE